MVNPLSRRFALAVEEYRGQSFQTLHRSITYANRRVADVNQTTALTLQAAMLWALANPNEVSGAIAWLDNEAGQ